MSFDQISSAISSIINEGGIIQRWVLGYRVWNMPHLPVN